MATWPGADRLRGHDLALTLTAVSMAHNDSQRQRPGTRQFGVSLRLVAIFDGGVRADAMGQLERSVRKQNLFLKFFVKHFATLSFMLTIPFTPLRGSTCSNRYR